MKPAFASLTLNTRRLPLTLAAACLGVGTVGLAATLYQPVGLSPFSAPQTQRIVADTRGTGLEPLIMPEAPAPAVVEAIVEPAVEPEPTAAVRLVANTRPSVASQPPAPAPTAQAAPSAAPPDASAAGEGEASALPEHLPVPPPSKEEAGVPPLPYFDPNANPLPVPAGVVAGVLPEPTDADPVSDLPVAPAGKK